MNTWLSDAPNSSLKNDGAQRAVERRVGRAEVGHENEVQPGDAIPRSLHSIQVLADGVAFEPAGEVQYTVGEGVLRNLEATATRRHPHAAHSVVAERAPKPLERFLWSGDHASSPIDGVSR